MRAVIICATLLVASLMFTNESQAQYGYRGGSHFGQGFGYGNSGFGGSVYGLGYVPVPPYFALHPPVYYSHEIRRRPIGDSPFAYLPQRPAPQTNRQFALNPFVPDPVEDEGPQQISKATDSVAKVIQNPFYGDNPEAFVASKLIYNPHYAKAEAVVAQAGE
ncbi:MAG: hypothetical protein H8E66_05780 [Planctomycetes bacterium]|nr:hypothetical protein [Planctomycetota bacterium]